VAAFPASERVTRFSRLVAYHLHHGTMCSANKTNPLVPECLPPKGAVAIAAASLIFHSIYSGVQAKEACNKDDNYHYADDVENVHCVLRSRYARLQYESAALD